MSRQDDIRNLIITHNRRLQILKEQRALQGISVDPKVILEIEDITVEIEKLQVELEELEKPSLGEKGLKEVIGAIELGSQYYIEREVDELLKSLITKRHRYAIIRGSIQSGKSSLLIRVIHQARLNGANVVRVDIQGGLKSNCLDTFESFTNCLAKLIAKELWSEVDIDKLWREPLSSARNFTYFMEEHILPQVNGLLVLAIDEASLLLQTKFSDDFFGLLRYWHASAALDEIWQKLNMIMTISTEPYLLIRNPYVSPFNVAQTFILEDFNESQVNELNQRYSSPLQKKDFDQFMNLFNLDF